MARLLFGRSDKSSRRTASRRPRDGCILLLKGPPAARRRARDVVGPAPCAHPQAREPEV